MSDVRDAYDRWAATYDTDPNRTRDLDGRLLRAVDLPWERLDVVEIGCGTGKNSGWLIGRCRSLVGLDLSPGMLARARERVPGATFIEADLTRPWPLPDGCADLVLADLVLEHVGDLGAVYREAARVLRAGGRLRISELHPYRQLRGSQAHFVDGDERVDVAAVRHSVSEYVNEALAAGFALTAISEDADGDEPLPRLLIATFTR